MIDDLQMRVMNFQPYGKNTIKLFKVSPDSWVQMAIQSAFYRTHGIPAATYESGGLRSFHEARTEVIRYVRKLASSKQDSFRFHWRQNIKIRKLLRKLGAPKTREFKNEAGVNQ